MEGCHGSRDLEGRRGRREQHVLLMQHQQQQLFGAAARVPSFGDGPGESEAGGSESEPARPRGSGSKRSRAAEVHNMSEKRRRSRINEKMKALQSLIPNSNKTDKASMLDEAIEYLKQLQLQVQMLSMRNGVYFHPSYFSGALEPTQASQMFAALGGSNVTGSNSGVVMPPINQSSEAHHSFDPLNSPQNHPPLVLSSVPNASVREPPFRVESSQPHFQSFQLPESSEAIFHEEIMPKHHLISAQERTSLPESNMKSIRQESPVVNADHFDGCSLSKEQQSQEMVPKNTGPA